MACQAADVCTAQRFRGVLAGQCCGAAGIGSLLIDLADDSSGERYRYAAYDVAAHMLLRSGPARAPHVHRGLTGRGHRVLGVRGGRDTGLFRRLRECGPTKTAARPPYPARKDSSENEPGPGWPGASATGSRAW